MLRAGKQFLVHVVPSVIKPIRVLWNEVIGFIFICIAVLVGFQLHRKFNAMGQGPEDPMLPVILILGAAFCLMLLWYGLSSFRRAKRISRS